MVIINGSDIEIFSFECLNYLNKKYTSSLDKEHVTFPLWDGREIKNVEHLKMRNLIDLRMLIK